MRLPVYLAAFIIISSCVDSFSSSSFSKMKLAPAVFAIIGIQYFTGVPTEVLIHQNKAQIHHLQKVGFKNAARALEEDFGVSDWRKFEERKGQQQQQQQQQQRCGSRCKAERHPRIERKWFDCDHCLNEVTLIRKYLKKDLDAIGQRIDSMADLVERDLTRKQHLRLRVKLESAVDELNGIGQRIHEFNVKGESCRQQALDLQGEIREKQEEGRNWKNAGLGATGVGLLGIVVAPWAAAPIFGGVTAFGAATAVNYSNLLDELKILIGCIDGNIEKLVALQGGFHAFKSLRDSQLRKLNEWKEQMEISRNEEL